MTKRQLRSFPRKRESRGRLLTALTSWVPAFAGTSGLVFAALVQPAHAEDAASFFAGKTMRIIVGLPPGGSADAYARLVQRHLPAHLPGAPSILVQNVPGAGGMKSVAYLESLPSDGTALATFSSGLLTEAITSPGHVNTDFRRQNWIGNVSEDARICYLWHTTGVRNWQDLLARQQVVFSASAPGTAGYVDAAMLRDLFGVRLKQINGYPGSAEMRLAVEKGDSKAAVGLDRERRNWLLEYKINVVVRLSPTLFPERKKRAGRGRPGEERERVIFDFLVAPENLPGCSWRRGACRPTASPRCATHSMP